MSARKGLVMVFLASVCFSVGGLLVKMIPWQGLSINSSRSFLSVLVLLVFAAVTRHKFRLTRGVLIGAAAVCGNTIFYILANKHTTAANAILLEFTAPAFVILFSLLVFREKPRKQDIIACVLVFGGIACFFLDGLGGGHLMGDAVAVLAGICYAWVFLMNRMPDADPLFSTLIGQTAGAFLGLPWLVRETDLSRTVVMYALILGIFQLGLAYVFLTTGIKYAPPIPASLVAGIEPVLNPILVALVIGETLSGLSIVGGVVVFVTVMAYNLLSARLEKPETSTQGS